VPYAIVRGALIRAAYGAALCCAPAPLIRLAGGPPDGRTRAVVRVLGARHLAQAAMVAWRPVPGVLALGVVVDMLHSASMIALAVADPSRRRVALTDGLIAAAFAVDGSACARLDRPAADPISASAG
jgi:hypothetical protein